MITYTWEHVEGGEALGHVLCRMNIPGGVLYRSVEYRLELAGEDYYPIKVGGSLAFVPDIRNFLPLGGGR